MSLSATTLNADSDDVQLELRPPQPRASPVGIVRTLVVDTALRRTRRAAGASDSQPELSSGMAGNANGKNRANQGARYWDGRGSQGNRIKCVNRCTFDGR